MSPIELDTTQAVFKGVISGSADSLTAELTDDSGWRAILLAGAEVFPGGWNLPPMGEVAQDGWVMVCSNLLTGGPSELTVGDPPDPRQSVSLRCRRRGGNGSWEAWVDAVGHTTAAGWLWDVISEGQTDFLVAVV